MGLFKKEPAATTEEVIEAIFELFTPEELGSMKFEETGDGNPDLGFKETMLSLADKMKPRHPRDKCVQIARDWVEFVRKYTITGVEARTILFREFLTEIFKA